MDTYEKKYKDLLDKAKKRHDENCDGCKVCLETLIPELAETEDERTRQQILNYFVSQKVNEPQPVLDSWIAWLEKQGKPNWSDDDEERLQSCISTLQGKGLMGGVDTINTKWLKSLKQRLEE